MKIKLLETTRQRPRIIQNIKMQWVVHGNKYMARIMWKYCYDEPSMLANLIFGLN